MKEQLYNHLEASLIAGLNEVDIFLKDKNRNDSFFWFFSNHREYPVISYFDNGMPQFRVSDHERNDYSNIFFKEEFYKTIPSWKAYYDFVLSEEKYCKYFQIGEFADDFTKESKQLFTIYNEVATYYFLGSFLDSYIHTFGRQYIESNFQILFTKFYQPLINEKLQIEIIVPILFTSFEQDLFVINDQITIEKLDNNIQKSRNIRSSLTNSVHSIVAGSATHGIRIKHCSVTNFSKKELINFLNEAYAFTSIKETVDQIFASLFISVPNLETGYAQIILF